MDIPRNHRLSRLCSRPSFARTSSAVAVIALTFGLVACDKAQEPPTVGQQVDSAIQNTEQAAMDAKINAEQALSNAGNTMDSASTDAGAAITSAANSASDLAEDASITAQVSAELAKDADLSAIKIDVDTQNGAVRLSGPAPSQAAKDRASTLAESVKGVVSVNNELIVKVG